ncbi:N-terminal binuclear Zn cluster-containing/DNA binding domain-containing protein [Trichoderma citrinoviride]|uniref:N-terminal binuclear Zn cluster-containing/DNA binding domain-containing protein n=1 Tax=Trichoderma citrinoviride TaxID=58853 RepID=A0A2T4AZY3_9HYPO|nr:N-terminal binuclear Zn cluster-containing/DNA binding domain-containing protein [Trichoderma citrinoviride]PTB62541.1 N-terminal binuclear Zn cluster-containing/DNA binding domain-containing protein [Trichoderma citrinoviride]
MAHGSGVPQPPAGTLSPPDSSSSASQSPISPTHGGRIPLAVADQPAAGLPNTSRSPEDPANKPADVKDDSDGRSRESAVPAACLACRSKHLKCDGQTPCSRCVGSNFECIYVASRRGYKGPRRGTAQNPNKRHATSPPDTDSISLAPSDCPMLLGAGASSGMSVPVPVPMPMPMPSTPMTIHNFSPTGLLPETSPATPFQTTPGVSQAQLYRSYCSINGIEPGSLVTGTHLPFSAHFPMQTLQERCIDSFYRYFHGSHPFVLPKEHLLRFASENPIDPLMAVIRWVGSLFIDVGKSRPSLYDDAMRLLDDPTQPQDGFKVQAMMLAIVALDGSCQNDKAAELLGRTETLALQIGLNKSHFASLNGRGNPWLEESWRRTWWDLFIIDGMIAGVHRMTNFMLYDVPADVRLPCEEHQYLSGQIPPPMTLEELEDRDFSGDERRFSSFAYRILCGRNLGRFMRTPPIYGPEDENLGRIENLLTNWRLHLPEDKKDSLQANGQLDEMMFQAHMMMYATSILLHQPHSQLDSSPAQKVTSCAPYQLVPAGDLFNKHTKHTIASANGISKLITHRVPLLSHTHFFTCVITLSSIVHLNKWALFFIQHDDDDLRQQIRLNIGALNELSNVWGAADRARGQVKGVAQEIYHIKKEQQKNPQYWLGFTQEDVINSMAADESIIANFDSMSPSQLMG